ncbi:GNAT family N-acetyltransferase [Streptomyces zhihengii]|uniref:GNAT family N-acetyltransferase n=1 Tax=Streptomyces zhihengii TaxID=1818004 RepID=UPI0034564ADD
MTVTRLPADPTDADVDHWHAVLRAAHLHDLPQSVPPPSRTDSAGKLRKPSARTRTVHLAVPAAEGAGYDGVATLVLFGEPDNRHTAFVDAFAVHPRARKHGAGSLLWTAVRAELVADGRRSVSVLVENGGPGEEFARARGFVNALPLAWYVQDLATALDDHPERPALPAGYAYAHWSGVVPDPLADVFARAHDDMADAPVGDLEQAAPAWDAARVRAAARVVGERGGAIHTAAILHTATDTVAAYTEVVLRDPADTRALQYDTVVVPAHRGRGLGRAVKRHLMGVLAADRPGLRQIATTVADENGPMLAVNDRLGYRRERPVGYFQATVPPGPALP